MWSAEVEEGGGDGVCSLTCKAVCTKASGEILNDARASRPKSKKSNTIPGYRGTSIIRNRHPVGPYSRTMPRAL